MNTTPTTLDNLGFSLASAAVLASAADPRMTEWQALRAASATRCTASGYRALAREHAAQAIDPTRR